MKRSLDVVQIAMETSPVAKVGGLGDVVDGLSRVLATRGHRVAIVLRSGLGSYASGLPGADEIPYSEISGFPVPKVEGHILAR